MKRKEDYGYPSVLSARCFADSRNLDPDYTQAPELYSGNLPDSHRDNGPYALILLGLVLTGPALNSINYALSFSLFVLPIHFLIPVPGFPKNNRPGYKNA
jgi:hypothetical protein